jgi:hypothetical protein
MSHQVTLELPEEVYRPLAEQARATGQTVETVAQARLAEAVARGEPGSKLRKWAGAFDSGLPDLGQRHDDYIGQALLDELRGRQD